MTQYKPINAITRKPYSGKNVEKLTAVAIEINGLADPRWMTFLQAKELGGHVKKGAKGTAILFGGTVDDNRPDAKIIITSSLFAPAPGQKPQRRVVKHYTVFHASQVEGIPPYEA
ncbi:MAG: ArdC family protein [Synergistaceae bacterium]|nr:ArdC family protein [Synergistaceae bacterium]